MGFLSGDKETKEEKKQRKIDAMMAKYGLENLTDQKDRESVRNIAYSLLGNSLIELGLALTGNSTEAAKLSYMNAIMEQNFIIIRQLDKISSKL